MLHKRHKYLFERYKVKKFETFYNNRRSPIYHHFNIHEWCCPTWCWAKKIDVEEDRLLGGTEMLCREVGGGNGEDDGGIEDEVDGNIESDGLKDGANVIGDGEVEEYGSYDGGDVEDDAEVEDTS